LTTGFFGLPSGKCQQNDVNQKNEKNTESISPMYSKQSPTHVFVFVLRNAPQEFTFQVLFSSTHYRNRVLCRVREALGKPKKHSAKSLSSVALGNGEQYIGKGFFAEYFFSGTRHRLCRVPHGTRQRKAAVTVSG
jgi:hypothetical protein